jgi:hypothetical protein
LKGSATWSVKTSGAAPVPPSPPSMVMKSGARPVVVASARELAPEAQLADGRLDADRQAVASARRSMKSSIVSTSWKAECAAG